jgi:hypothetical protein
MRRAALLLPVSLAACGSTTEVAVTTDAGPPLSDGAALPDRASLLDSASASDSAPPPDAPLQGCALSTPALRGTCNTLTYFVMGPAYECPFGLGPAYTIPLAICQAYCPADPRIGAIAGCTVDLATNELTCVGANTDGPCGTWDAAAGPG